MVLKVLKGIQYFVELDNISSLIHYSYHVYDADYYSNDLAIHSLKITVIVLLEYFGPSV